ncbi:phosphoribosyltransferase [Terriglobus roseus]|uniref:Putative phosphoribosyl transferase n=1 Tax=Terriglobus roseus TaxID=392734 RepID=A0A1H4L104_9BACT|nr:phosphoribosyltransferase family protein [Terriglobus roseus]SEB64146.1 putative phosphoribosyl transferase [Terriglobus roseus]
MMLADRKAAGKQLAARLLDYAGHDNVLVLGIPRGGVPVAFQIASRLDLPLDIFLSRKLGVPAHEELAFGAIATGDGRYLDQTIVQKAGLSPVQVEEVTQRVQKILSERAALYRSEQARLNVTGKTVLLVDDGIATGASVYAAILALRQMKPAKMVVAAPVVAASTRAWLQKEVDALVYLLSPKDFQAVGQFYTDFEQTTDREVIALLAESRQHAKSGISAMCHQSLYASDICESDDRHDVR